MYRTQSGLWLVGRKAWHKDKVDHNKEISITIYEDQLDNLKEFLYTFLVEFGKCKRKRDKGASKKGSYAMSLQEKKIGVPTRSLSRVKKSSIDKCIMTCKKTYDELIDVPKSIKKDQIGKFKKAYPELKEYLTFKYSGISDIFFPLIRGLDRYNSYLTIKKVRVV